LTQEKLQSCSLNQCEQIVVYGANGWMGRSAVDFISSIYPAIATTKMLLIGSKSSFLNTNGSKFEIIEPSVGFELIAENAVFLNAAFLRREFLGVMTYEEYLNKNEEITIFAKNALKKKKVRSFINLSSGIAREFDNEAHSSSTDEYARLKKRLEVEYAEYCNQNKTAFINCRIFSLTGRNINEFDNLALSSFINQAKSKNKIEVKSPFTKRTYVDATSLAGTLLSVAALGKDASFDSGGELVTMAKLAERVMVGLGKDASAVILGNDASPDYVGDFEKFNSLAKDMGQSFFGIDHQIAETLTAFKD